MIRNAIMIFMLASAFSMNSAWAESQGEDYNEIEVYEIQIGCCEYFDRSAIDKQMLNGPTIEHTKRQIQ